MDANLTVGTVLAILIMTAQRSKQVKAPRESGKQRNGMSNLDDASKQESLAISQAAYGCTFSTKRRKEMTRETMRSLYKRRANFIAKFKGIRNHPDTGKAFFLLVDIKLASTHEQLTNHVWIPADKARSLENIRSGNTIMFSAVVRTYTTSKKIDFGLFSILNVSTIEGFGHEAYPASPKRIVCNQPTLCLRR